MNLPQKPDTPRIAVLMATYNSSRYIEAQLDSLTGQTVSNWKLYVRDDGSGDNTIEIIERYGDRLPGLEILPDEITNHGPRDSFMWLLDNVEADYYMFCDHDDVWLPDKIEETLLKMLETEKAHPGKPVVVNTDLRIVDGDLRTVSESFWEFAGFRSDLIGQFDCLCACNFVTGCTMMLNNGAKDISLPVPDAARMHDSWIALRTVSAGGILASVCRPTMLYRMHGQNAVGIDRNDGGMHYYVRKMARAGELLKNNMKQYRMVRCAADVSPVRYLRYKYNYITARKGSVRNS